MLPNPLPTHLETKEEVEAKEGQQEEPEEEEEEEEEQTQMDGEPHKYQGMYWMETTQITDKHRMDSYINLSMDILYVTIAGGQAIKGKIAP